MAFGIMEGLSAAGALGGLASGRSSAKASKELLRRQGQLANMQNQTYRAAQPIYQDSLKQLASHAQQANGQGAGLNGAWGNEQDRLRMVAAEDDISRLARQRSAQLQHTMGRRGIATGTQGAALARNESDALQQLAAFRRQLAINAPQEYERRQGMLLNAMNPAFGQGAAASAAYGQQGQYFGQQASNSFGAAGGILQNYMQQSALDRYLAGQQGQWPAPSAGDPQGPALPGTPEYERMRAIHDAFRVGF